LGAPRILPADAAGIAAAAEAIRHGELVGMPTETVYGLAGDAGDAAAVAKIYAAKGRPRFNPLISHLASTQDAMREAVFDERASSLAESFWPGPLTLVLPVATTAASCELARAGLDTIALRVPDHPTAQALLQACGRPLAAPSANRSGRLSPTRAADVAEAFDQGVALVLEGGTCRAGIESTIVGLRPGGPPVLLRPGAIARERIEAIIGALLDTPPGEISAPGQLQSHYAPNAKLRLDAVAARQGEVLLAFGPDAPADALNLSATADTTEAAANLYPYLRKLDAGGAAVIAVMPVPEHGLGEAINDRLRRAAAPRGKAELRP
jgi:L-threonylcarbamoyladenylate synthase